MKNCFSYPIEDRSVFMLHVHLQAVQGKRQRKREKRIYNTLYTKLIIKFPLNVQFVSYSSLIALVSCQKTSAFQIPNWFTGLFMFKSLRKYSKFNCGMDNGTMAFKYVVVVFVRFPRHVLLLATPWTVAYQATLSLTIKLPTFVRSRGRQGNSRKKHLLLML